MREDTKPHLPILASVFGEIFGAALLMTLALSPAAAATEVDMELILAVDASGSVDAREYALQLSGIAAAFRDPEVLTVLRQGYHGRIGVALVTWAETGHPKDASSWHVVGDRPSAGRLASLVEGFPRRVAGGTGIGRAVIYCVGLFDGNGLTSRRRVIDLSGDGRETTFRDYGVGPDQARAHARAHDVAVNGLAILNEDPKLEAYYRSQVIVGNGAFTLAVSGYEDFAAAMRLKLLREIAYRPDVSALGRESAGRRTRFRVGVEA